MSSLCEIGRRSGHALCSGSRQDVANALSRFEPDETVRFPVIDRYPLDPGMPGSVPCPLQHLLHRRSITFKDAPDRAVGKIGRRSGNTKDPCGLPAGISVADALDIPTDVDRASYLRHATKVPHAP